MVRSHEPQVLRHCACEAPRLYLSAAAREALRGTCLGEMAHASCGPMLILEMYPSGRLEGCPRLCGLTLLGYEALSGAFPSVRSQLAFPGFMLKGCSTHLGVSFFRGPPKIVIVFGFPLKTASSPQFLEGQARPCSPRAWS